MQFRWVIGIALWTSLSGPVFAPPRAALRSVPQEASAASRKHAANALPPQAKPVRASTPKGSR